MKDLGFYFGQVVLIALCYAMTALFLFVGLTMLPTDTWAWALVILGIIAGIFSIGATSFLAVYGIKHDWS